ncbi:MAG: YdeI/OmpD-associated family protein [Bacteroidota bacterium]
MKDARKLFNFGMENEFSRSIKFNNVSEINEKYITDYVKESVAINKAGYKRVKQTKEAAVPDDLYKALRKKPAAVKFFDSLANGYKNEFIELVETAKRQETRDQRIQKVVALCAGGC